MSFSEERVRLETRRDESGDEKRKISELIDHLDTKKLETIRHTFTSISTAFTDVFKKLGTDITAILFALDHCPHRESSGFDIDCKCHKAKPL